VGSASASSKLLVCSDWVPPSAAARACTVTRTRFTSGCWAVSWTPAVWVWNRSIIDLGSFAPNRSRMIAAHMRRAARNFATSSRKVERETKKNDSRGAKRSTSSPASTAACTYAMPSARVNATSCTGVAPASPMWYPEIEMVLKLGSVSAQYPKVSEMIRRTVPAGRCRSRGRCTP
jgi:hypothetical protein